MATPNTSGAINRITRELANARKNHDLSIAVTCRDQDVRHVRALILGPPETPYEFGFFEFDMRFPKEYPIKSPSVKALTTNGNTTRFNPNIYAEGKVCLSILGTWRGNPGEEWSSAQGMESVLLSIQSLMSSNPYENEPGFENTKKEEAEPVAYVAKIRHETLRIAVIERMENLLQIPVEKPERSKKRTKLNTFTTEVAFSNHPYGNTSGASSTEASLHEYDAQAACAELDGPWDPFADLIKRRFLWYYDAYLRTVDKYSAQQRDGLTFKRMTFEYPPNSMEGAFNYKDLRKRLEVIRTKLDEEKESWVQAGAKQVRDETGLATQLKFQFTQLEHKWNDAQYSGPRMELSLPDKQNPFVWRLCLFGEPMTNLDGGIFNMDMHIPPNFPTFQPRVHVETPIYHHRVSGTGTLCYFPEKEDEISSHLTAIVAAFEDKDSVYDPRAMVNPEVFALKWGKEDERKIYGRKLRRSAQESSEFL